MPVKHEKVQAGTVHRIALEVTTDPKESGRAAGFELQESIIEVGVTRTDLGLDMPVMAERAYRPTGGAITQVTDAPVYSAGLGPMGENVLIIEVASSAAFVVGDFVRGQGKDIVHEVLAIPDGTHLRVHSSSDDFDIEDGDNVEEVTPSGTYVGFIELDVDDNLSIANPTGDLHIVATTLNTGNDPVFSVVAQLTWTFQLELDLAGRGYKAG